MKRYTLFFALFLSLTSFSQTVFLSIDTVNTGNLPYAGHINDTISISFRVRAIDTTTGQVPGNFSTSVRFFYQTDSMIINGDLPVLFDSSQVLQYNPNTPEHIVNTTLFLDASYFSVGGNIIIVWPTYAWPSNNTLDSVWIAVIGTGFLDVSNPSGKIQVIAYPNPVTHQIALDAGNRIMREIIWYDATGVQIRSEKINHSAYTGNMEAFLPGSYRVRVLFEDGSVYSCTIIKQP